MNKAEEQLLYQWGKSYAVNQVYNFALADRTLEYLKDHCEKSVKSLNIGKDLSGQSKGQLDHYSSILRLIDNNIITDWPSFVTHMTGETYE